MTDEHRQVAPIHRMIVAVDVEGYTQRTNPQRVAIREALYRVLDESLREAGVERESRHVEDRGDGLLLLLPADTPKLRFLDRFLHFVSHLLGEHNVGREDRLRLRAAIHAGEVVQAEWGVLGEALDETFRLLASPQLRAAQSLARTDLAVGVTDSFYREVVQAGSPGAGYRRVVIDFDGHTSPAWIYFPGPDPPPPKPPTNGFGADDLYHRSIFLVDIADSSSRRDDVKRLHRAALREMVLGAIDDAGVAPGQFDPPTDTGDGLRVLFQPEVGKNRLAGPMITALCTRLARFNATAATGARMRLRFVLSSGELRRDEYDYFGNALNEACWLLDSQVLRDCLDDSHTDAVLMVSNGMYENVIRHGYGDIDPATYQPRTVPLKTGEVLTWVSWDAAARPGTPRPR
jgi:class 3 adenylate cyclase